MQSTAKLMTEQAGFRDVEVRVFRGGHALDDQELAGLVAWWLPRDGIGPAVP